MVNRAGNLRVREMHPWPPDVTVFDGWPDTYPALANEVAFPIDNVHDAAERVRQLIERIANGPA